MQCAACSKPILQEFALNVIDRYFHDDCLKCACCKGLLAELSRICYYRSCLLLCTTDYMRLFGRYGQCAACKGTISPMEYVLTASTKHYHLDCFSCAECNGRFCVGDSFYLIGTKIYCPNDYAQLKQDESCTAGEPK